MESLIGYAKSAHDGIAWNDKRRDLNRRNVPQSAENVKAPENAKGPETLPSLFPIANPHSPIANDKGLDFSKPPFTPHSPVRIRHCLVPPTRFPPASADSMRRVRPAQRGGRDLVPLATANGTDRRTRDTGPNLARESREAG